MCRIARYFLLERADDAQCRARQEILRRHHQAGVSTLCRCRTAAAPTGSPRWTTNRSAGILDISAPDFAQVVPEGWVAYLAVDDVDARVRKAVAGRRQTDETRFRRARRRPHRHPDGARRRRHRLDNACLLKNRTRSNHQVAAAKLRSSRRNRTAKAPSSIQKRHISNRNPPHAASSTGAEFHFITT